MARCFESFVLKWCPKRQKIDNKSSFYNDFWQMMIFGPKRMTAFND